MATAAVKAMATRGVRGMRAILAISRPTGGETATAYPPMMIIAICRVNVLRDQKPCLHASTRPYPVVAVGSDGAPSSFSPVTSPSANTAKVPTRTKPSASGSHFSVNAVNRRAIRASQFSRPAVRSSVGAEVIGVLFSKGLGPHWPWFRVCGLARAPAPGHSPGDSG